MGFSRQGYCSELPFPSPGDLPDPGIKPGSAALQADSLLTELWGKPPSRAESADKHCLFLMIVQPIKPEALCSYPLDVSQFSWSVWEGWKWSGGRNDSIFFLLGFKTQWILELYSTLYGSLGHINTWSFILIVVKTGTQFLGHVYFKTSSSPMLGQHELCNIELSFHYGLIDVILRSELAHKWSLHFLCDLWSGWLWVLPHQF